MLALKARLHWQLLMLLVNGCAGAKRGILGLSGVEEDVGMIGLHWNHRFLQLVPWQGSVTWEVCKGIECAVEIIVRRCLPSNQQGLAVYASATSCMHSASIQNIHCK